MNNLRTVIILIIFFIVGVSVIYWIYQSQIAITDEGLLPIPDRNETIDSFTSPTPEPVSEQPINQFVPDIQPEAGSNTLGIKNIGIQINQPEASSKIISPVIINGSANVSNGQVNFNIKDANGTILGSGYAIACIGYDACPFEVEIEFETPSTSTGLIEASNPQDGSQVILVRF